MKFEQNTTEEKIDGSEKEAASKKVGNCGIFGYKSMEREIINYNDILVSSFI